MTLFISLGIIFAILAIVLFVPVGIGAKYDNGVFVIVKLSVFKLNFKVDRKIERLSKKKEDKPDAEKDLDKSIVGIDFILSLLGDFRKFVRKKVKLEDFELNIKFGTEEAASTAVSAGALWALSYNLLGLIDKVILVKNPKVNIEPVFNQALWQISASGIVVSRLAHIITVVIVFVFKYLKYKKNKLRRTNK